MKKYFRLGVSVAVIGLVFFTVGAALAFPFARRAYGDLKEGRARVLRAGEFLRNERAWTPASAELFKAADAFAAASGQLRAIGYLQAVPWVSRNFKAVRAGAQAAEISSNAIADVLTVSGALQARLPGKRALGEIPLAEREAFLRAIEEALPKLQKAKGELASAGRLFTSIATRGLIAPLESELEEFKTRQAAAMELLDDAVPLLELAPFLGGYPEARQYLVVLQNSDEMRPSGGFLGTYGILKVEAGRIKEFATDDVYNLDRFVSPAGRPLAPLPLRTYLQQPRFYLRDANWSPDFPTSARTILQFYAEESKVLPKNATPYALRPTPMPMDGVIAIMPEAIVPFLQLTGPITAQGQTFTAENFTDALEYEVEIKFDQKGIPRTQRKEIISKLGHALIEKLLALPVSRFPDILHEVRRAFDEKQLLIYATSPRVQELLESRGWSGAIAQSASDYLGVFDANLFALKTDPYITRSIFYQVRKETTGLVGEVELVYAYPKSGPAWKTKGYRSFTRVYVPKGSILVEAKGAMKEEGSTAPGQVTIEQEFDKTVFGAFFAVQSGEVRRLKFKYRLPEFVGTEIADGRYALYVQKQAGTIGHSLTVAADFGKVLKLWSPRDLSVRRDRTQLTWQTALRQDQQFNIEF